MASFQQLVERMHNKPLDHDEDNKKIKAIKNGLKTRASTKEKSTFWEDFIQVCGDADSLSHLLGVSKYDIAGWAHRVKKYLKLVREEMDDSDREKKKKRHVMTNTGDGAATGQPETPQPPDPQQQPPGGTPPQI